MADAEWLFHWPHRVSAQLALGVTRAWQGATPQLRLQGLDRWQVMTNFTLGFHA